MADVIGRGQNVAQMSLIVVLQFLERLFPGALVQLEIYIKEDDFFGLQNYTRSVMDADGICAVPQGAELTQMDYEIYPQALEACIRKVYKELNMPVIVTENGIAVADDTVRVDFINKATDGVANCIADGIPVKGYLYWSLMDNFEWQKGYSMTFGLIAVDRSTQKRTAKPSLKHLGGLIERS